MRGAALILLAAAIGAAATARPRSFTPPAEDIPARFAGPEGELVTSHCATCHSLDYLATQPPGKSAQFWRDAVTKMVKVYGAPIQPDQVEPIVAAIVASEGR